MKKIDELELENIIGGNMVPEMSITILLTVLSFLVIMYKLYSSSSGKAKMGNNYSFEWS